MLDRIPQQIDLIRYTDSRNTIKGSIRFSNCDRLIGLLAPEMQQLKQSKSSIDEQQIHIEFIFGVDDVANRFLTGTITTNLLLTCQRCMQTMQHYVDIDIALAFIKNRSDEQVIAGLYDSFYIENDKPLELYALIEDEIILSLPLIAKHDDEQCVSLFINQDEQADEVDIAYRKAQVEAKQQNPFAVLQQLKVAAIKK